jgi:hypothetical protein
LWQVLGAADGQVLEGVLSKNSSKGTELKAAHHPCQPVCRSEARHSVDASGWLRTVELPVKNRVPRFFDSTLF